MNIRPLDVHVDGCWEQIHQQVLALYKKYAIHPMIKSASLHKLSHAKLLDSGSSFLLATIQTEDGERIAGFAITTHHGRELGIILVHPLYRNLGIGARLLAKQLTELQYVCYYVSLTNKAAIQMCFNAGLIATGMLSHSKKASFLIMEAEAACS